MRFQRGYTKTASVYAVQDIDVGPCPYDGWDDEYYRIYVSEGEPSEGNFLGTELRCEIEDLVTIDCGKCLETNTLEDWTKRIVSGGLSAGIFQCPVCNYAFTREVYRGVVSLKSVDPVL